MPVRIGGRKQALRATDEWGGALMRCGRLAVTLGTYGSREYQKRLKNGARFLRIWNLSGKSSSVWGENKGFW